MINKKLAILIPAFNEEKTIGELLKELSEKWDVFVIEDKSLDNTLQIVKKYKVCLIKNSSNIGYSLSIQKGISKIKNSGYHYVITFDGDGEHRPKDIPKIFNLLKKGNAMVVGSRDWKNRFIEKITSFFTNLFFKIEDPFCGLKGFDLYKINNENKYLRKPMEDVNTYLMFSIIRKKHKYCNYKVKVGQRVPNLNSRFGINLIGEIKLLKSLIYWI